MSNQKAMGLLTSFDIVIQLSLIFALTHETRGIHCIHPKLRFYNPTTHDTRKTLNPKPGKSQSIAIFTKARLRTFSKDSFQGHLSQESFLHHAATWASFCLFTGRFSKEGRSSLHHAAFSHVHPHLSSMKRQQWRALSSF